MWRRPVLLALIVALAVLLAVVVLGRGTAHFADDFANPEATRAGWRFVGGESGVEQAGGQSALRLAARAGSMAVAIADRGRRYQVANLTLSADVRVGSGLGGIAFGMKDQDPRVGYRLEVDPKRHVMTLYERNPDGAEFDIAAYRDERIAPGAWWHLRVACTEEQFMVLAAFGVEQPKQVMREWQDHEHPGIKAFAQGRVGLYAQGGTAWFGSVTIQGAPAAPGSKGKAA